MADAALVAELELELAEHLDRLLDVFERCEQAEVPAIPVILDRLRARGVEMPAWVEMML